MPKKISACPGWLELSEDRTSFILTPDRAEIVRKVFELSIAGLGGYTIAKYLNTKNVPAFGPSGRWDQSTIHNMLSSRATFGEYRPKQYRNGNLISIGEPVGEYYPAVIEHSLFQAAQEARQKNLASGRGRKGRLITNLFADVATCLYCGAPIKFHSNGKAKSLMCLEVLEGRGCYRMAWSYGDFEAAFFQFVLSHETDPSVALHERKAVAQLAGLIRSLSGSDTFDARLNIAVVLRTTTSKLSLACAGPNPSSTPANVQIRRNGSERFFELSLGSDPPRRGFPVEP
jgi:hypothetical protein